VAGAVTTGLLARRIKGLLGAPELGGAVDLLGAQTPAQIAAELARASAFVLPSHIENSPNALCEAMLVGTPCIAAFVGGVPSLVKDGEEGLLFHDADPFALAAAIDRLLGDRELASHLGAAGRATARRRHDPERIARQAAGVYGEVLSRPGGTGVVGTRTPAEEVAP
jgi:glycosyltransferase involved in cell wall biosynthesis